MLVLIVTVLLSGVIVAAVAGFAWLLTGGE